MAREGEFRGHCFQDMEGGQCSEGVLFFQPVLKVTSDLQGGGGRGVTEKQKQVRGLLGDYYNA